MGGEDLEDVEGVGAGGQGQQLEGCGEGGGRGNWGMLGMHVPKDGLCSGRVGFFFFFFFFFP